VIAQLTLLHIILAALACGSLYLAWREVRRRYISQWRLLAPPAPGLGAALGLALIQIVLARSRAGRSCSPWRRASSPAGCAAP